MLSFDLPTLLVVISAGAFAVSVLLTSRWLGHSRSLDMRLWAAAFACGGVGALLQGLRGVVPSFLIVVVSNFFIVLMVGLVLAGFRAFDQRPLRPGVVVAGPLVWLVACAVPAFYASFEARTILVSLLMATYSAAIARHALRVQSRDPLPARSAIIVLFAAHVVVVLTRIPMLYLFPVRVVDDVIHSRWIGMYMAEGLIHIFLVIIAILALARDRTERAFRRAAETDVLTGVANRRAFVASAEAHLAAGPRGALLLIDIDHFKAINDTHGHQAGDEVLAGFAARAAACLSGRPHSLGRIGGEEFGVFLPDSDLQGAVERAEYLREAIAATAFTAATQSIHITVSIGVASAADSAGLFERLFGLADAALYRAKSAGRNRVRAHEPVGRRPPPLHVVAG